MYVYTIFTHAFRNEYATKKFSLDNFLDGTLQPPQQPSYGAMGTDRAGGGGVIHAVPRLLELNSPPPFLPPPKKKNALRADHFHEARENRHQSIFAIAKGGSRFQNSHAQKQVMICASSIHFKCCRGGHGRGAELGRMNM